MTDFFVCSFDCGMRMSSGGMSPGDGSVLHQVEREIIVAVLSARAAETVLGSGWRAVVSSKVVEWEWE